MSPFLFFISLCACACFSWPFYSSLLMGLLFFLIFYFFFHTMNIAWWVFVWYESLISCSIWSFDKKILFWVIGLPLYYYCSGFFPSTFLFFSCSVLYFLLWVCMRDMGSYFRRKCNIGVVVLKIAFNCLLFIFFPNFGIWSFAWQRLLAQFVQFSLWLYQRVRLCELSLSWLSQFKSLFMHFYL